MQKCEIMLYDLIDSKRTNGNIKATITQTSQAGSELGDNGVSMDVFDATIISSNFWPQIQDECPNVPGPVDQLLSDYAKRFNEIKTPRKLLWKKSLGTVKGILAESFGADSEDHVFPLMEGMVDSGKKGGTNGSIEDLIVADEKGESSVASVEDQLHKEMTVYEKFILGMLTNFGSMALD
ncbi:anaphase-promoting complex subunit 2-like [Prunus dulcis]|uniref:anaphase-promoting complex subunit 2-like n=1 Tax=Prunus dulcis TaxID=3755 RepID=UPI00148390A6|nr:anaphase-promoting complex subunit 2-like [Prunus dulcis]XP_034197692.1 anaphase-promoting complex subunit 2-like [Prunus dulcis]